MLVSSRFEIIDNTRYLDTATSALALRKHKMDRTLAFQTSFHPPSAKTLSHRGASSSNIILDANASGLRFQPQPVSILHVTFTALPDEVQSACQFTRDTWRANHCRIQTTAKQSESESTSCCSAPLKLIILCRRQYICVVLIVELMFNTTSHWLCDNFEPSWLHCSDTRNNKPTLFLEINRQRPIMSTWLINRYSLWRQKSTINECEIIFIVSSQGITHDFPTEVFYLNKNKCITNYYCDEIIWAPGS